MTAATVSGVIAIVLYIVGTTYVFLSLSGKKSISKNWFLIIGLAAAVFHTHSTITMIFSPNGIDLGLFTIASLIGWVIIVIALCTSLFRPFENITVTAYPIAAFAISASLIFASTIEPLTTLTVPIAIHILLSICAYSVLFIAVGQAILVALQNRQLKQKHSQSILKVLPPLQTMESILFEIIWIGMLLLSASIVTGFLFHENILAQHLAHKTVFSIIAWFIFAILLAGRHFLGWRGKTAIRWTYSGFIFLMLGYFGSKFVLEYILTRA